jgi:UDP-2,3-diacylglucosamine pyrophosphatase LpxH
VGDDGLALPFPASIARTLAKTAATTPVRFMHGNRDFLVANEFAKATGIELIADPTVIDLYGTRTALPARRHALHGRHEYQKISRACATRAGSRRCSRARSPSGVAIAQGCARRAKA